MHTERDFRLIETMRFDGLALPLLDRHVARLSRSAQHFGFPFDADRMRARIHDAVAPLSRHQCWKVRLTLDANGTMRVETDPIAESTSNAPHRLVLADVRVDPDDDFRKHKTTRRAVYQRAQRAAAACDADEALLLNTSGEVTEATWSNVVIQTGDRYLTPPVTSGALPGVYRDYLLDTRPNLHEATLTPADLRDADGIFCCNAVRGWRPSELLRAPQSEDA